MPEALKESLFNSETVGKLAGCIAAVDPSFDQSGFIRDVFDSAWPGLELKDRLHHVTIVLKGYLPVDYPIALDILRKAATLHQNGGFVTLVYGDYVERYGLEDWDISLPALGQFTCLCSAEYAVRPFLVKDPTRMIEQMLVWAESDNPHHRRLASEGCRPRLPWGIALQEFKRAPQPIMPILEKLKADPEEYVRRSVANNLNDISKDNPRLVIELLQRWKTEQLPAFTEIANRALRTLVKKGDPVALELVGAAHGGEFEVNNLVISPHQIPFGGLVTFSFDLHSSAQEPQNLVVDFIVHLARANGKQTPKVFKLSKKILAPGETLSFNKRHSFAEISSRRYYPGAHAIEIQVNGIPCARADFEITEP